MLFKILKKIAGIYGFKLVDKNLIKNNRLINEKNLYSLKDILETLFKNKNINQLIQIGSNDGLRFDIVNEFIKRYSIDCVLVEPIKTYYEELKQNYNDQKNVSFENLAISVNNEINYLYKVKESKTKYYDDHIKGIASFNKKHLKKHGVKSSHIEIEKINNISINELISKYGNKVDLLIIDAEGYDGNIVIDLLENSDILPIKKHTSGQATTCLLAKEHLADNEPLFITSCDYETIYKSKEFLNLTRNKKIDVIVWTFRAKNIPLKDPKAFAYCKVKKNSRKIEYILEKNTISKNPEKDPLVVG